MAQEKGFLQTAYSGENREETRQFYQDWAKTYDQEIIKNGYVTPGRCAQALAEFAPDKSAPVLDVGCGTGLSGRALKDAGFSSIDGCDLASEMLAEARKQKILYRDLWEVDPDTPFPFEQGTYTHIVASGVIAGSHAPAETIDQILAVLPPDGLFAFSLNDHTLQDPEFEARIAENVDSGFARLLFKEYGEHLPGINMRCFVYVLQRV